MSKNFFLGFLLIFLCSFHPVFAQQQLLLRGVLYQKQSGQRVANALIADKNSKITTGSNDLGGFSIKAAVGDTLRIFKNNFADYIYVVSNQQDIIIQMSPLIQLNEVKVVGQTKKQELDEAMGKYRGQGSFYNGKPPISAFSPLGGSPITGFYELFGKTPRQAKHFQEFSKLETEQIKIDKRFNKEVVKQFTDLAEEQLQPFVDSYRPSLDQLSAWNDYDLINYIKKSAQGFKEGKGLPPLKKLY